MQVAMPGSYGYNRRRCAFAHGRTVVYVYVWHYIAGLAVAALIIMIALNALNSSAKASRESFARAAPAVARVLKVGKSTASHSYRGVVIDLLIQVHPRGAEPYELNTMWAIDPDAVSKVQVGKTLDIKIDLQDPTKIYSNEIWARSLGVMKEPIRKSGD
jgi:hypothetical protein